MCFVGERYYKLNKVLLLCLGLWPYQSSFLNKIQTLFYEILLISFLLCQLNAFLVKKYSIDLVIKMFLFILINFVFIVKYNAWILLTSNIKNIFNRIQYDWKILKVQEELEIIRGYAYNARFYTICFFLLVNITILGFLMLSLLPSILDMIVPMNESRPRQLPIVVEYFIDKETYFVVILTHIIVTNYAGSVIVMAIATILIAYALHTCALFKIASYRIEHIFDDNILQMPRNIRQYILHEKLIYAVYIHRRAIDLVNILTNSFATFYFVLIGLVVTLMSLNFFHAVLALNNAIELILSIGIAAIQLYYTFLGNYVGQTIIDTSINIHYITYDTQWYAAPLCIQKLILFIMQRSKKKSALTAGGLFDASLEGFAKLMSMSISYFMVLQSMRKQE